MFLSIASAFFACVASVVVTLFVVFRFFRPSSSPESVSVALAPKPAEEDPGAWAPVLISSSAALSLDEAAKTMLLATIKASGNPRVTAIELIPDSTHGVVWSVVYSDAPEHDENQRWILAWDVDRLVFEKGVVVDVKLKRSEATFPKGRK